MRPFLFASDMALAKATIRRKIKAVLESQGQRQARDVPAGRRQGGQGLRVLVLGVGTDASGIGKKTESNAVSP
jgi:hypothetical protein